MTNEAMTEKTWSMDRIATLLVEKGCVGAYVEQTGGGCATIYAGTGPALSYDEKNEWGPRYALVAGPGWFEGPRWTDARVGSDFCFGADDEGDTDVTYITEGTEDEIADQMFAFITSRPDCKLELAGQA